MGIFWHTYVWKFLHFFIAHAPKVLHKFRITNQTFQVNLYVVLPLFFNILSELEKLFSSNPKSVGQICYHYSNTQCYHYYYLRIVAKHLNMFCLLSQNLQSLLDIINNSISYPPIIFIASYRLIKNINQSKSIIYIINIAIRSINDGRLVFIF